MKPLDARTDPRTSEDYRNWTRLHTDEEATVDDVCGIRNFIGVDVKDQPTDMTILEAKGRQHGKGKEEVGASGGGV
ncbi:hypothetical protein A2U01_0038438 [Trifolium medium]|uniref:Uncharacterized protein n=1 Tax=Trifolium medium TaxID=97028 RepID=A0A392PYW5_9FABA|nr:hypothetical protein [Trifolium medium]